LEDYLEVSVLVLVGGVWAVGGSVGLRSFLESLEVVGF
jgi:hypothetical protein